jgi:hypothetical protein
MADKDTASDQAPGTLDGMRSDEPAEPLLDQLATAETSVGADLTSEMAHDLVLLLYTLSDFGELGWPLI